MEMGVSQEGLADLCGLHRTYVSSVERAQRNVSLSTLEVLASALGIDPPSLLQVPDGAASHRCRQPRGG